VHIDAITFGYNQYLIGLTILFNVNGRRVTRKHYGTENVKYTHTVNFEPSEHIVSISATWSENGLHTIEGYTNYGQDFAVEGFVGYGP
jgi:hypothetical protein